MRAIAAIFKQPSFGEIDNFLQAGILSPGKRRLLVMADPCFPAKQGNLSKLQEHGSGWSGDPGVADRHKKDWMVTAPGGFKERCIAAQ
jgi:hypothetical protein